jgi:hypothetical protein
MALEDIVAGIRTAVEVTLAAAEDVVETGGATH